jgi:hypothetical protein
MAPGPDDPPERTARPEGERLTPIYRRALALEAEGIDKTAMARELDVPVEAIPSLLRIARAKTGADPEPEDPEDP